jgi:tRNA A-37 threonylcarbamoyl transferase component Bud32
MPVWDPKANEIFGRALDCASAAERQLVLDESCRGDSQLRERVDELLSSHERAGDLLEHPAWDTESAGVGTTPREGFRLPGTRSHNDIGPAAPSLDFLAPTDEPGVLGRLEQYAVLAILGHGGMGIVLKARDTRLNREVAIKVLAPTLATNATARQRFIRETQAAAAVRHDHIVTIHGVGETSGLPFLVMEYVAGESLQHLIDRQGALEPAEIVRLGVQMAAGLAAAHDRGLVHRDIKPANILIEEETKRAKITDFGVARAVDDVGVTQEGVVAGTPQYMAPEQARGESVDHRADLFSLGSVLYAMCTGRAPYQVSSTVAMLRHVCEYRPQPIGELNPGIPDWIVSIIDRLHAKSPAERFQSAAEVADALNGAPNSVAILPARRRRLRPTIMAAALLVGASFVALEAAGVTSFATTIVQIVRGDGTLVFESDESGVSVQVNGEDVVIRGEGSTEIRVAPGSHRVTFLQDGRTLDEQTVTISRGGRVVARIRRKSSGPATSTPGAANYDELIKQARLRMSFDEESFYEKDGQTYVRDLSGHGNDGICENVGFTPHGRMGGGLQNDGTGHVRLSESLIAGQSEFTIAAWVHISELTGPYGIYQVFGHWFPEQIEPRFHFRLNSGADAMHVYAAAWNSVATNKWVNVTSAPRLVRANQWAFLAVVLDDADASQERLRIVIDDRVMERDFQSVGTDRLDVADVIARDLNGTMDELAVWQRALSRDEVQRVYQATRADRPVAIHEKEVD